MNKLGKVLLALLALLGLGGSGYMLGSTTPAPDADIPGFATSSTAQVGDDSVSQLFPDSSCKNRVITTNENVGLYLAFSSSTRGILATDGRGTYQAASTSVTYEGKVYGCGAYFGKSTAASSSVNVYETR